MSGKSATKRDDYIEWAARCIFDVALAIGVFHYWLNAPDWVLALFLLLIGPLGGIRAKLDRMDRRDG